MGIPKTHFPCNCCPPDRGAMAGPRAFLRNEMRGPSAQMQCTLSDNIPGFHAKYYRECSAAAPPASAISHRVNTPRPCPCRRLRPPLPHQPALRRGVAGTLIYGVLVGVLPCVGVSCALADQNAGGRYVHRQWGVWRSAQWSIVRDFDGPNRLHSGPRILRQRGHADLLWRFSDYRVMARSENLSVVNLTFDHGIRQPVEIGNQKLGAVLEPGSDAARSRLARGWNPPLDVSIGPIRH